jgi:ketosteroid isomerase-like protein
MTVKTPAGRLATSFGDVDRMAALYAPDVRWSLPASLPFARPTVGKEAIVTLHRQIWSEVYRPDVEVTILDEVGDDACSAVRFFYRAFANYVGRWYENEYTLFVRSGPEGVTEVFEAFDTTTTFDFYRGEATKWKGL